MHDSDPAHKGKDMSKIFQVFYWPGNCPDFTPTENCWAYMKRKLQDYETTLIPHLIQAKFICDQETPNGDQDKR